jgi:hypothetical protein
MSAAMKTRTTLPSLAVIFVLSLPVSVFAQDTKTDRDRVQLLLMAYDHFPNAAQFEAASPNPRKILLEIAGDGTESEIVRLQALDGLSLFPDASVRTHFRHILGEARGTTPAPRATHNAINGLVHGWGLAAAPDVLAMLTHPDPQVRMTVVHALRKVGDAHTRAALRDHLSREKDPIVQELIETHAPPINKR